MVRALVSEPFRDPRGNNRLARVLVPVQVLRELGTVESICKQLSHGCAAGPFECAYAEVVGDQVEIVLTSEQLPGVPVNETIPTLDVEVLL